MSWHVPLLFAQAVQPAAQPAAQSAPHSLWYVNLAVALGTIALSFVVGSYLGKKFRMPDHGWKIGVILFSLLASGVILLMGPNLKLGVDLSGGVILVYEVDQAQKAPDQEIDMDKLIAAVAKRINPGGQKEVVIRKYGKEQIEVIVPLKADEDRSDVERIKRAISRAGTLEFRILARKPDNRDLIEQAEADPSKKQVLDAKGNWLAKWLPVKQGEEHSFATYGEIARRMVKRGDRETLEVLVVKDIYDVNGGYLTRASSDYDRKGQPCVTFMFNNTGGQLFAGLTGSHLPDKVTDTTYKLGIVLDGDLYSAPSIQSTISDRGEITGTFTPKEVHDLVSVLNAGSLPVALAKTPISEMISGATLGEDTINKSTNAMILACILVPLFMLWYYRFCGIVANIALALNMLILFAIMLSVKAAFTLTGFAGLALTVGMAVDNNILVFERLREELDRGATLRMAIRNAFHRAGATVIDCNVTHMIVAVILFYLGSDQLKGFAITLGLGVVTSMYTAVFVSHVIFNIAEKRQWITKLKMLRLIGHTNIDFMSAFPYCLTASILISVAAIGVSIIRGQGLFDIDFTGGVSVQAQFTQPQDTGNVRAALAGKLEDLAISDVRVEGETPGLRFNINTSERSPQEVQKVLTDTFSDKLLHNEVKIVDVAPIAAAAKPAEAKAGEKSTDTADPFAGGTLAKVECQQKLKESAVDHLLVTALEDMGLKPEDVVRRLTATDAKDTSEVRKDWTIRIMLSPEKTKTLLGTLARQAATTPLFPASSTIGGAVAGATQIVAIMAIVASWVGIIVYLWIRFQAVAFGLAAVVALVHDVLVMLGAIAVSIYIAPFLGFLMVEPFKINLAIVAAFLTIIGYSVNDTIVVFDRIREVRGKDPRLTREMVNISTNQTLSRTLLTSLTVFLVVVVLYFMGGDAIHGFAFSLLAGVITGTYSSIYIAAPILLWLVGTHEKKIAG